MEKIIHKLNKDSRYQIAINYVNDKYKEEFSNLTTLMDGIASTLIQNHHSIHDSEESFDELCNMLEKSNIKTGFFHSDYSKSNGKGIVATKLKRDRDYQSQPLPDKIFIKNDIKYGYSETVNDLVYLHNNSLLESKKDYSFLLKRNDSDEMSLFLKTFADLRIKSNQSFQDCYDLLKKVRTAELLMKHWSNAFQYLPDDLEIDSPETTSLSEKFAML